MKKTLFPMMRMRVNKIRKGFFMTEKKLKLQPIFRAIVIVGIVLILYLVVRYFFHYIYPFVIAFFLAYLLHPIVSYLQTRWHIHRTIATSLIIILFFSCSIVLSYFLLQQLGKEMATFLSMLPTTYARVNELLTHLGHAYFLPLYHSLQTVFPSLPPTTTWSLEQTTTFLTDKLLESSTLITKNIFTSLSSLISSLSHIFIVILFISISGFIMTKDYHVLQKFYHQRMPRRFRTFASAINTQLKKSTFGMIKAHFFLALLTSMIAMIGLLVFRVEHVLFLTAVILLVDLIPYVGIGLIFIPWILYQFLIGEYTLTIQLTVMYMIIILIRQFIEPKLIATHIGLHPLVAVILLFVAINMFGLLGVFLTPIMFILISAIYHTRLIPTIWHFILHNE